MTRLIQSLALLMSALAAAFPATAETAIPKHMGASAHGFAFATPEGEPLSLKAFSGKLVLVVNTATECGFSGQIGGLQTLYETYRDRGLVVLGVPSNDFGGQEPRTDGDIASFCEATYGARFPMTAKTHVKGKSAHPFYRWATSELGRAARPHWNFHKYLLGPDGALIAWFPTPTPPLSPAVTTEIERALANLPET
ncbi:glutathione peroxidase [Roseibium aggregatum]|nr:glutathione peroxidase [Roseibium aggregatum]